MPRTGPTRPAIGGLASTSIDGRRRAGSHGEPAYRRRTRRLPSFPAGPGRGALRIRLRGRPVGTPRPSSGHPSAGNLAPPCEATRPRSKRPRQGPNDGVYARRGAGTPRESRIGLLSRPARTERSPSPTVVESDPRLEEARDPSSFGDPQIEPATVAFVAMMMAMGPMIPVVVSVRNEQ